MRPVRAGSLAASLAVLLWANLAPVSVWAALGGADAAPVAASLMVVYSGSQANGANEERTRAVESGIVKSSNRALIDSLSSVKHLHLEAEAGDLFHDAAGRQYMAEWLKKHMQVMDISVVVSVGDYAAEVVGELLPETPSVQWAVQCDVLTCDHADEDGFWNNTTVARTCVHSELQGTHGVRLVRELKPTTNEIVLLDDDSRRTGDVQKALSQVLEKEGMRMRIIRVHDLVSLESSLLSVQNLTDAFVVMPSYENLSVESTVTASKAQIVGELISRINTLGELVSPDLLAYDNLAGVERSLFGVAETCGFLVGLQKTFSTLPRTSSQSYSGTQLFLNVARETQLKTYGVQTSGTIMNQHPRLVSKVNEDQREEVTVKPKVLMLHAYAWDYSVTSGQHDGFIEGLAENGLRCKRDIDCRTILWFSKNYFNVHELKEFQGLFSAEYIYRLGPQVTFTSDDNLLSYLGHACSQRIWTKNPNNTVPAYIKVDNNGDYHPCHATQILSAGINAEPKTAYAHVTTGGAEDTNLYVEGGNANIEACAAASVECNSLYSTHRPMNISIVLERDNIASELEMIALLKPSTRNLVWIGDQSPSSDALYKSMRAFYDQASTKPSIRLAEADMHQVTTTASVLDLLRTYQSKQDYFVYIPVLGKLLPRTSEAINEFWRQFIEINKLGERVLSAYVEAGGFGHALLLGASASPSAMGNLCGINAAALLKGNTMASDLDIYPAAKTTTYLNLDRATQLAAYGFERPLETSLGQIDNVYTLCAAGFYRSGVECVPCPPNTLKLDMGDDIRQCINNCPAGSFLNGASRACEICPPGSASPDGRECRPCRPGTFQTDANQSMCNICEQGWYQDKESATGCIQCPLNAVTKIQGARSLSECICMEGFYPNTVSDDTSDSIRRGVPGVECLPCVSGGVCKGDLHMPYAAPNFFCHTEDGICEEFWQCRFPNDTSISNEDMACPGGTFNDTSGQIERLSTCHAGNLGGLCATCEDGHSRDEFGVCNKCSNGGVDYVIFPMFVLGALGALLWLYCGHDPAANDKMGRSMNSRMGCALLQILAFVQTIGLLGKGTGSGFGYPFHKVTKMLGIFMLDTSILKMDCYFQTNIMAQYMIKVTWPLGVLVYLAAMDQVISRVWSRHKPTALSEINLRVFSMCYILIIRDITTIFTCDAQLPGGATLREQPDIMCWETQWLTELFPIALLGILIYGVGFPLFLGRVLHTFYYHGSERSFREKYSQFIRRFDATYCWWEMSILVRKLCLSIFVTLPQDNTYRLFLAACIISVSAFAQHMCKPYFFDKNNFVEISSMFVLLINIALSYISLQASEDIDQNGPCTSEACKRFVSTLNMLVFFSYLGYCAYIFRIEAMDYFYMHYYGKSPLTDEETDALRNEAAVASENLRQSNDVCNNVSVMLNFVTRASDNDRNSVITLTKRLVRFSKLHEQGLVHVMDSTKIDNVRERMRSTIDSDEGRMESAAYKKRVKSILVATDTSKPSWNTLDLPTFHALPAEVDDEEEDASSDLENGIEEEMPSSTLPTRI